mgnify:CR=1 FL=1
MSNLNTAISASFLEQEDIGNKALQIESRINKLTGDALVQTLASVQENQSWELMPQLLGQFAVAIHFAQKDLSLYCIDLEYGPSQ